MSKDTPQDLCRQCCCFCCPCCFPENKVVVCDVYQPIVPTEKEFGFPQKEVQISHPPPARELQTITSQPRKAGSATRHTAAVSKAGGTASGSAGGDGGGGGGVAASKSPASGKRRMVPHSQSIVLPSPPTPSEHMRPFRSKSMGEKDKKKQWRVLSSPVRSRHSPARETKTEKATASLQSLELPLLGSPAHQQTRGMRRAISHDPSKFGASASPSPSPAPSPTHTPTAAGNVHSDPESAPDTPVFQWSRSKSTGASFHHLHKTIFKRPELSLSITCPTPTSAVRPKALKKTAVLEFNLYHDAFRESLNVHIHRALYLPPRRGLRSIDTFIQAHLEPSKKQNLRTRVIVNSRSPAFDQLLEFSDLSLDEFREQTLVLQVYYRDVAKDRFISSCYTKLADLDLNTNNQIIKKIEEGLELRKRATYKEIEEMLTPEAVEDTLLSFTLYYDQQESRLLVYLAEIINLPTNLPPAASNPYVQIYLLPAIQTSHRSRYSSFRRSQHRTRVVKRGAVFTTQMIQQTHQPNFEATASFSDVKADELASQELVFRVYVNGETHFVGGVFYPIPPQESFGESITAHIRRFPEEEGLKKTFLGDILLSLCYKPEPGILTVTIVEMKLKKCQAHEHISPYIKVNLMSGGERLAKWRSSVKRLNPCPVYKETCQMELKEFEEDTELQVWIKKSEYLSQQNEVGLIKLGREMEGHKTGESHWVETLTSPNTTVTTWHPIFPPPPTQLSPMGQQRLQRSSSRSRSPSPSTKKPSVFKPMLGMQL